MPRHVAEKRLTRQPNEIIVQQSLIKYQATQGRTTSTALLEAHPRALRSRTIRRLELGSKAAGTVDNSISVDELATLDVDNSASSGYWLNSFVHRTFG